MGVDSKAQVQVGKPGWEKEAMKEVMTQDLQKRHGETLSTLDALRRSRVSRGGVGAPLDVPVHLQQAIVITDAVLNDGLTAKPMAPSDDDD